MAKEMNQKARCSRINSMLSVWYGLMFGSFQAFLIVQNVRRFVWFAELSWPYQRTPYLELNSYIILTGVAVLLLPFFLASSILQVGNTANDSRLLGKHLNARDEWAPILVPSMLYQNTKSFFRTVWTHSGPTSSLIHIISSFCLLLPQTLMEAVLLKFGYLPNEALWKTDLDALIPQGDRNSILKILSAAEGGKLATNASYGAGFMDTAPVRLEYLNYGLALTIFSLRYASVFWHSNKGFATVFSLQLLINTFHGMISYSAFTVIYKVHVVGTLRVLLESMPLLLNPYTVIILHLISSIILLASSSVLYHYGYMKIQAFIQLKARTTCISSPWQQHTRLRAYLPHLSALGVFLGLAASQSPIVHDAHILYSKTLDNCLLALIISAGAHLVIWIILWIALSAKRDWKLNVAVKLGNIRVKGLESLKLVAEMNLEDPSKSMPRNALTNSVVVIASGKVYTITNVSSQREIMGCVQGSSSPATREGDEGDRVYWPRPCPPAQTSNSLDDEIQPWLEEATASVTRNKVTFYDDQGSPRKFSSVPLVRGGAMKRSFRAKEYSEVNQQDIDDGDYAVLKRGKGCLKPQLASRDPKHPEFLMPHQYGRPTHSTLPGGHKYEPHYQTQSLRGDARMPLDTPQSVLSHDSGYPGTADRNGSRSASSTGSPPDRSVPSDSSSGVHSSGVLSSSTFAGGNRPQSTDCYSQECCPGDVYGNAGLLRRESMRSAVIPNYHGSSHGKNPDVIYQSRMPIRPLSQKTENNYGESQRGRVNESPMVSGALSSPPYYPSDKNRYPVSSSPAVGSKYTNINTANEMEEQRQGGMVPPQDLYGRSGHYSASENLIKTTPYGRCTNMRLSSFAEHEPNGPPSSSLPNNKVSLPQASSSDTFVPPIPPPLPPLSFSCLQGIPPAQHARSMQDVLGQISSRLNHHSASPNGSTRGSYGHS